MFRKDRTDEPIYWGLFGAGGMAVALGLPIIIITTFFLGCEKPFLNFLYLTLGNPFTSLVIIGVMILAVWHAMHRIYHTLHDLSIKVTVVHHIVIYGLAALITVAFAVCYVLTLFL